MSAALSMRQFHACQSLTFRDLSFRRAAPAAVVLRGCGAVLQNSAGSALTFEKSREVLRIMEFISHNWSVGRFVKFLILAVHYNIHIALTATVVAVVVVSCLVLFKVLPLLSFSGQTRCIWNIVLSGLVFVIFLIFGRDILCLEGPTVFLDKVCIHQTDKALMKEGIRSLAAYLRVSEGMLVVFSDSYLKKLWTVYELASVLITNPKCKVTLVPPILPRMAVAVFLACAGLKIGGQIGGMFGMGLFYFCMIAHECVILYGMRSWHLALQKMEELVSSFDARTAKCFVESDRAIVSENITDFMHTFGLADIEQSQEYVITKFNEFVHAELPRKLRQSMGRNGFPFRYVFIMVLPAFLSDADGVVVILMRLSPRMMEMDSHAAEPWLLTVDIFQLVIGNTGARLMKWWGLWLVTRMAARLAGLCCHSRGHLRLGVTVVLSCAGWAVVFGIGLAYKEILKTKNLPAIACVNVACFLASTWLWFPRAVPIQENPCQPVILEDAQLQEMRCNSGADLATDEQPDMAPEHCESIQVESDEHGESFQMSI